MAWKMMIKRLLKAGLQNIVNTRLGVQWPLIRYSIRLGDNLGMKRMS